MQPPQRPVVPEAKRPAAAGRKRASNVKYQQAMKAALQGASVVRQAKPRVSLGNLSSRRRLIGVLSVIICALAFINIAQTARSARASQLSQDGSASIIEGFLKDVEAQGEPSLDTVAFTGYLGEENPTLRKPRKTSLFPELRELFSTPDSEPAPRPQDAARAVLDDDLTDTWRNKVSFIAGLIAVHRPTLPHSGELAKDIVELSLRAGVDPFYTAAIISVESSFGPGARSHKGATGLMQLMPETAREVLVSRTGQPTDPRLTDPRLNISLGITYIKQLEKQYNGDRRMALAAYNWGPGNVSQALRGKRRIPKSVAQYAKTVLERAVRWRKQFEGAKHSASSLVDELT